GEMGVMTLVTVQRHWTKASPHTPLTLAERNLILEKRADGAVLLRCGTALAAYPTQLGEDLRTGAARHAERVFLAERGTDGAWMKLTYGEARAKADAISQWLLDNGHGPDNPVAALSDNSLALGLLMLGAMQISSPSLPVSPAYSLMSKDYAKVKYVCERFTPSLIYVETLAPFVPALRAVSPTTQIVAGSANGEIPRTVP